MLLSDATARHGDLNEGQLGDVLFNDGRTFMATFGSKRDHGGAGKPVAMPAASEPGLGAALLVDSSATVHQFVAFRQSWRFRRRRAGPSYSRAGCRGSLAGESAGARSPPLTGIPAHSLPIFGPRSRGCLGVSRRLNS